MDPLANPASLRIGSTIKDVESALTFAVFLVVWYALQVWVLPKMGVPT